MNITENSSRNPRLLGRGSRGDGLPRLTTAFERAGEIPAAGRKGGDILSRDEFEEFYQICVRSAEFFIRSKKYEVASGIILTLCRMVLHLKVEPQLPGETLHELAWMLC